MISKQSSSKPFQQQFIISDVHNAYFRIKLVPREGVTSRIPIKVDLIFSYPKLFSYFSNTHIPSINLPSTWWKDNCPYIFISCIFHDDVDVHHIPFPDEAWNGNLQCLVKHHDRVTARRNDPIITTSKINHPI